jgi:hypothetical protein
MFAFVLVAKLVSPLVTFLTYLLNVKSNLDFLTGISTEASYVLLVVLVSCPVK